MLRSGVKPGLDLQRSGCRRRFIYSLGEAELCSTRVYLIAFFFFFPTASGHAQWAHTCPTLPHGSSEKMPTTSEFSLGGGQKKVVSHSSSCYHSVALTPLREEKRKNVKETEMAVATPAFFPPCKTGCSFLTQIGGSQQCRPV